MNSWGHRAFGIVFGLPLAVALTVMLYRTLSSVWEFAFSNPDVVIFMFLIPITIGSVIVVILFWVLVGELVLLGEGTLMETTSKTDSGEST